MNDMELSSLDVSQCTNEYSIPGSMTSNVSLNDEEKELLYVQLEDCISQMHAVMGYQQAALKCCRQTLVSGCHYIVNDIICTHYSWLDEKNFDKNAKHIDSTKANKKGKKDKKHQKRKEDGIIKMKDNNRNTIKVPDFNATDKKNIQAMRKGVLKSINMTLTELMDPARVFASKISKEMFNGEDITLKEVTAVAPTEGTISHGHLRRARESKDAHRKGKFTSTSLAIQAIFSHSSCCPETRKFLLANGGKDDRALALARLGKGKNRNKQKQESPSVGESSQASSTSSKSSQYSIGSSLEFSLAAADGKNVKFLEEIEVPVQHAAGTVNEFKSLLIENGIDPQKRSKLGLTQVAIEPEPNFLAELNLGKSAEFSPSKRNGPLREIGSKLNPMEKKKFEDGNQILTTEARARLMTLAVSRSKNKYKDETLLQNSSHPNAKYRKNLLSTGGNSKKLL